MPQVGTFRGICIDSHDPSGLNRIRVQVPQVMGESVSGWAWPAWTIDDMSVWPEDRFPKPGDGVWVRFESVDRMAWSGAYGLPEPAGDDPDNAFDAVITNRDGTEWTPPTLPFGSAATITGLLTSLSGTPNPAPATVALMANDGLAVVPPPPAGSPEESKWVWTQVGTAVAPQAGPNAGEWSITYTRNISTDPRYVVRFLGTGIFAPTSTEVRKYIPPTVATTVAWTAGDPAWKEAKTLSGTITSPEGVPTQAQVNLMISSGGGAYTLSQSTTALSNGTWSMTHTRTDPAVLNMKVVFAGKGIWLPGESAVKPYGVVTSQPVITWDLPSRSMILGVPVTFTGTVTAPYGPPTPNNVQFQIKVGAGTWNTISSPTIAADGTWSYTYTPDQQSAEYRMSYTGTGIFGSALTPTLTANISYTTTTKITSFPASMTCGTAFTVVGTVKDSVNRSVTRGTAELWYQLTNGSDLAWYKTSAPTVSMSGSGTFSISHPANTYAGPVNWKVKYLGDGGSFQASESSVTYMPIGLAAIGSLTKGSVSHTYMEFYWPSIPSATNYLIYLGVNNANPTAYTWAGNTTGYGNGGLGYDTTYGWQVQAAATDAGGNTVYGPLSPQIKNYTGHPESRKSGSFGYECRPTGTGSYRPDTGWGYIGDKPAQGYYSDASRRYTGIMDYDEGAFQNWVAGQWGWDVVGNLSFDYAQVAMYRVSGVGSGSARAVWWYVSSSGVGGGDPAIAGGSASGSLTPGQSAWIEIPAGWAGHVLRSEQAGGIGTIYSLATRRDNSTEYCQWLGRSGASNACNLYVECSWNFVTVAYAGPGWY